MGSKTKKEFNVTNTQFLQQQTSFLNHFKNKTLTVNNLNISNRNASITVTITQKGIYLSISKESRSERYFFDAINGHLLKSDIQQSEKEKHCFHERLQKIMNKAHHDKWNITELRV